MNRFKMVLNEIRFAAKDSALRLWMTLVLMLSALSVGYGLADVHYQHKTVAALRDADQQERAIELAKVSDWGSAAYYSFHLTYDPPSNFAYAAMGQRDVQPWKHRIRMLALEGQIYERDVPNPSAALIGRFDFAFLAACVFPLVLILLLYDVRASERRAGRYNLLESMANSSEWLWRLRILIGVSAIIICLLVPMILAGLLAGARLFTLFLASLAVVLYGIFWGLICYGVSAWRKPGSVILMSLVGIWLLVVVVFPASARLLLDRLVPLPSGADILMLQRETVNDAWDLPRDSTMKPFFEHHPEWADYQPVDGSFDWAWYYAFQQVGDQKTEPLAEAYREGRRQRDHIASWVSLFAPPALLERSLQALAKTDVSAQLAYENKVRLFHGALRAYYYPKFFRNQPFDKTALKDLPEFTPD